MKNRFVIAILALCMLIVSTPNALADDRIPRGAAVADAVIVRPIGVVVTVVSSAAFVVALPFAAIARKVPETAEALVARPARTMFCRKLGDFRKMRHENVGVPTEEIPRYDRR